MRHALLLLLLLFIGGLGLLATGCRMRGGQAVVEPSASARVAGIDHQVVPGDSLWAIAEAYGVTTRVIIDANDLRSSELRLGQILRIPGVTGRRIAPPPAVVAEKTDWYVPRTAWARVPIVESLIDPMSVKPYRMTVHHSSEMSVSLLDAPAALREIERQHMAGLGKNTPFACIGYHYIIGDDGQVYEGRPIRFQGAHATGPNNIGNIGICVLGDFDHHQPSKRQMVALDKLLDRLCGMYGIQASPRTIFCHKDFVPTACPGTNLEPLVRAYAHRGGR